jgi:undecaprenyl pyrophosphate synthase
VCVRKQRIDFEYSEMIRQHDVRIRIIGHLDLFPLDVREACEKTMRMTEHHQG